jgi:hypothetical protein
MYTSRALYASGRRSGLPRAVRQRCHVQLADGIYLDPEINIFYYRFISVTGNCDSPQAVVLRATKPGILVRRRTMNTIRMVLVADMAARGAWSELWAKVGDGVKG